MGKKGSWFSAIKRVFLPHSKEKLANDPERKSTKDKKKKGLGKLRHAETNSFIPLFREPSSIEKIFGDFEREQQKLTVRPPTPPEQPRTPPFVPPRVASPRAPSPRVASPRVASPRVASPRATSPRAASPRIVHHHKEISYRPEPTLRTHHASATKIQAAYRGYMARRSFRALKGLMRLQGVVRGQNVKRQTVNAMKYMQLLVRVQSQIQSRRIQMLENQARRQAQFRNDKEVDSTFGKWSQASEAGNDDWDDSLLTKEEREARLQRKVDAVIKRERAMAYAYSHQLWKATPKSTNTPLADIRSGGFLWWWNWLERQQPPANPPEGQAMKSFQITPPRPVSEMKPSPWPQSSNHKQNPFGFDIMNMPTPKSTRSAIVTSAKQARTPPPHRNPPANSSSMSKYSRPRACQSIQPFLETEIETVPSQTEGQRKSKLYMHFGEPVDPPTLQSVSTSGTSKKAAVEQSKLSVYVGEPVEPSTPQSVSTSGTCKNAAVDPTTIPPSGKSKGSQPIDVVEIELPCQPDSQQLLELRRGAKRSIEHMVGMILSHVSNTTSKRIGVHGSGGIGKTSVLKALINHPNTKYLFDVNIWVSVSRNWSMRKIQNEVLRQLSLLPADSKTDSEIAEELFQSLKCRRFLLLLDDVWEQIDLHAIGIPDPTLENGCRMIIATRSLGVCRIMATDVEIQVKRLLEEEAWELFREQVGGIVDSPNIEPHAQDLVQKCHGLPLLIIVTGRALTKEIDVLAWMHAVREFSQCSAHGMYGFESLIQKLKFSYDRLEGLELKSCFLYCALFPEDWEVSILDLVEYWIHEGLISGNWTDAYKRAHDMVNILVGASLLQSSEGSLSIKMHDLIRDLASGILSLEAEGCQFLLRNYSRMTEPSDTENSSLHRSLESFEGNRQLILESSQFLSRAAAGLTEPPLNEEWEEAKMIFLMDNELSRLPERPSCPKLLALFLQRNHHLRMIPSPFFDLMPFLKVLNLSRPGSNPCQSHFLSL